MVMRKGVRGLVMLAVALAAASGVILAAMALRERQSAASVPIRPVAGYDHHLPAATAAGQDDEAGRPARPVVRPAADDAIGLEPEPSAAEEPSAGEEEPSVGQDEPAAGQEQPAAEVPAIPAHLHESIRRATDRDVGNTRLETRPDGSAVRHIDAGHKSVMAAVVGADGKLVVRHGEDFPEQPESRP